MSKALQVPQPGYQIGELVQQRRLELVEEEYNETVNVRLISYLSPTDSVRFQVPEGLDKLVR
jgi:hypothetical protein